MIIIARFVIDEKKCFQPHVHEITYSIFTIFFVFNMQFESSMSSMNAANCANSIPTNDYYHNKQSLPPEIPEIPQIPSIYNHDHHQQPLYDHSQSYLNPFHHIQNDNNTKICYDQYEIEQEEIETLSPIITHSNHYSHFMPSIPNMSMSVIPESDSISVAYHNYNAYNIPDQFSVL